MNGRIKLLAEQAGGEFYTGFFGSPNSINFKESDLEKFAELIVRECCQKLENDGMVEVAMEMKQHFGVEE